MVLDCRSSPQVEHQGRLATLEAAPLCMQVLTTASISPQVEHQGRLATLEAVHEAALADARDGALAQNLADQNRLTKLAADHLRALHSADELNTALRSELAEVRTLIRVDAS